jgi:hypothetical protein
MNEMHDRHQEAIDPLHAPIATPESPTHAAILHRKLR